MKKITLVFAFMLAVAGAVAQSMYVHKTDGNVYEFKVSDVDSINFAASTTDDYLYTITYMPNGGKGEVVIDTVVYGDSYTIRGYGLYTKDDDCINGWNTEPNGSGVDFAVERVINGVTRDITLYAQWIFNIHDYVDLGLPSGTKWATCNVGATKPEEYGNYYAWGETEPKTDYTLNTYKWATATKNASYYNQWDLATLPKYNTNSRYGIVDNKTVLEFADDAAFTNWGGAWRMPTDAEWTELRENCTWTLTSNYNGTGVAGRIVTSKINGNSIFLPAAGYLDSDGLNSAGDYGRYWSSSLETDYPGSAWSVYFYSDKVSRSSSPRYYGLSVRPVF